MGARFVDENSGLLRGKPEWEKRDRLEWTGDDYGIVRVELSVPPTMYGSYEQFEEAMIVIAAEWRAKVDKQMEELCQTS